MQSAAQQDNTQIDNTHDASHDLSLLINADVSFENKLKIKSVRMKNENIKLLIRTESSDQDKDQTFPVTCPGSFPGPSP